MVRSAPDRGSSVEAGRLGPVRHPGRECRRARITRRPPRPRVRRASSWRSPASRSRRCSSSPPAGPRTHRRSASRSSWGSRRSSTSKIKDGGPLYFASPFADNGFWLDLEHGQLVALDIVKPGTKDCVVKWKDSHQAYVDCDGNDLHEPRPRSLQDHGRSARKGLADGRRVRGPPRPLDRRPPDPARLNPSLTRDRAPRSSRAAPTRGGALLAGVAEVDHRLGLVARALESMITPSPHLSCVTSSPMLEPEVLRATRAREPHRRAGSRPARPRRGARRARRPRRSSPIACTSSSGISAEEPARRVVVGGAEQRAAPRVAQVEALLARG